MDLVAGPAHPGYRDVGVVAELLCHPRHTAADAVVPDRAEDGRSYLLGTRVVGVLERGHEERLAAGGGHVGG